ncbi:DUF3991 and toprim domain-containing protein [Rhizobium leguminosarum]|uniref:DUF3991 and toprim domain-containing protein n=1 Tax=Rhizobium leguminosarum TaxID=384 RepID=UPI001DF785E6|nr:hypothetical protein [Rhizobium leguminosarum]
MKESTRRAVKYRRSAEIIIVTHEGRGWFDPLSEAKGDAFSLVCHLDGVGFSEGAARVAALVGFIPTPVEWQKPERATRSTSVGDRWYARKSLGHGSNAWRYLCSMRALPINVVRAAVQGDLLREGPFGSVWAAHTDSCGCVVGWEERGQDWRGFASGGSKVLFRFGGCEATRLCVTEAAIDAMSLAAIEGMRDGTLYVSTGGGWSPTTEAALRELLSRQDTQLVAATDANPQGDRFADRLRGLADEIGRDWLRLRPTADDWNAVLQERRRERIKIGNGNRRAASRPPASREAAPG